VAMLTIHAVLCQSAVPAISKGHNASIFRVKQPFLIGRLDSEVAGTVDDSKRSEVLAQSHSITFQEISLICHTNVRHSDLATPKKGYKTGVQ